MVVGENKLTRGFEVDPAAQRAQVRRAALASSIGTTIEWYDFFLYNTAAALVFPHLFFPASSPYAGAMASFGTYAVGFAARPIGAAIFGHWGDLIGRKATLIVTLLVMGISSAIVGILPGTAAIGVAAPLLLVLLRLVQGIAIGGEWSGSVLIAMEWGDQRKRGLRASFAQLGVPMGLVLGTGGMTLLSATLSTEAFNSWGWRVPFLFSLVLVAVGLMIRLSILETPMFAKVAGERKTARIPVVDAVRHHWREIHPYFSALTHGGAGLIVIAVVFSLVIHALQYGPQASLIAESFPTHLRYGGAGLGYQLASVFAGGPAPLIATWLLHKTGTPYAISAYIVFAAVVTVACVLALPDRSRVDIEDAAVYRR